jgi:hypothetical protein
LLPGKSYRRWLLKALEQEWPWRESEKKPPPALPTKFKKIN